MEVPESKEVLSILWEVLDYMEDANSSMRSANGLVLQNAYESHDPEVYNAIASRQRVDNNYNYALKHKVRNLIKQLQDGYKRN